MNKTIIAAAAVALFGIVGSAQAATLTGTFNVKAINVTNVNSAQSQATLGNFNLADAGTLGGALSVYNEDTFVYTGSLDFFNNGSVNPTTIASWLGSNAPGFEVGLDGAFGGLTLSKSSIGDGTATTTFFKFDLVNDISAGSFSVRHDDGIAIIENGVSIGGFVGPNTVRTTNVGGFTGGAFSLLYVATNNDPSILNVDSTATVAPVPVPAPLALLASALVGLGLLNRRRAA